MFSLFDLLNYIPPVGPATFSCAKNSGKNGEAERDGWDFPPFSFVLHRGSAAFAFRRLVEASVDHRTGGAGRRTNTTLAVFWSHSRSLRLHLGIPAVCDYWLPAANVLLFSLELCDIRLPVTMHVIKRGKTLSILAVHLASAITC